MSAPCGEQTLGHFALVSYIPEPLAGFLDRLRIELVPDANPRAHVTVLPPRPVHENLREVVQQLAEGAHEQAAFDVELLSIEVFPGSNVVYLEIGQGREELIALYRKLNQGPLEYCEFFPYHPHITIAQKIDATESARLATLARERWAEWDGPRTFPVGKLLFVQHVAPQIWADVAPVELLAPVPAL